jgi:hypothetical protein
MQRGQHNITDELIFANHEGYIFHDSLRLESPWLIRELVDLGLWVITRCFEADRATGLGSNDATRLLGLGMFFLFIYSFYLRLHE